MFVMFIAMIFALYYHQVILSPEPVTGTNLLAMVFLPRLAVGFLYLLLTRMTLRRLATPQAAAAMSWLDRIGKLYHAGVLFLFISDLRNGLLLAVRQFLGSDWVLVDEIIVLLPSLVLIFWGWVCFYPVDRRLREASLMRRLDQGLPPMTLCTRGQYVLNQLRHQVLVVLIPLLALYGGNEVVDRLPESWVMYNGWNLSSVFSFAVAGILLLFSPVMLRYLWDTEPLPAGPLRESLEQLCQTHGVKVRRLLLWRTYGTLINAAVMGLIAPIRYIMLTDALLENMPQRQVEAVMAHEVAHVRRRHLIWLVLAAAALLMGLESILVIVLKSLIHSPALPGMFGQFHELIQDPVMLDRSAMLIGLVLWFLSFGWVSRRFERQADTFAVQHLSMQYGKHVDPQLGLVVDPASAVAMIEALQRLANLNHLSVHRNSWRHGSIRWRQTYLESLIGRPVHQLPIDDQILWMKAATVVVLLAGLIFELYRRGFIA